MRPNTARISNLKKAQARYLKSAFRMCPTNPNTHNSQFFCFLRLPNYFLLSPLPYILHKPILYCIVLLWMSMFLVQVSLYLYTQMSPMSTYSSGAHAHVHFSLHPQRFRHKLLFSFNHRPALIFLHEPVD